MNAPLRFRLAAALPFAAAIVVGLVSTQIASDDARHLFQRIAVSVCEASAILACFAAAFAFDRGDYMRPAWMLNGISIFTMWSAGLILGHAPRAVLAIMLTPRLVVDVGSALIINITMVGAMWLYAVAWNKMGLATGNRWVGIIISSMVALAVCGVTLVADVRAAAQNDATGLLSAISDLGDMSAFALVGGVLLTAWSLRGGLLAWPWSLLTLGVVGWLVFDATGSVCHLVGAGTETERLFEECFIVVASLGTFSAALTQRWVVQGASVAEAPMRAAS
jgi:hypothetical protein